MGLTGWFVLVVLLVFFYQVGVHSSKAKKPKTSTKSKRQQAVLDKYKAAAPATLLAERPLPKRMRFSYKDADGEETEREVLPKTIDSNGVMIAHCLLRRANRSFHLKRILGHKAINTETGEEFDVRTLRPPEQPDDEDPHRIEIVLSADVKPKGR